LPSLLANQPLIKKKAPYSFSYINATTFLSYLIFLFTYQEVMVSIPGSTKSTPGVHRTPGVREVQFMTKIAKTKKPVPAKKKKKKKKSKKRSHLIPVILWTALIAGLIGLVIFIYGYYQMNKNKPLAVFNGGEVSRENFIKALKLEANKYDPVIWKNPEKSQRIKEKILDEQVREKLLLSQVEKNGITASEKELKTDLNSYKSGYTEDSFQKMLKLQGVDYKDWVEKKKNTYLIQKLIQKEVIDKIEVDPKDVREYYNEHKEDFSHPAQVRARHILVSNWEDGQEVIKELESGGNFAAIAKQKSISPERWKGGDLGYFSKGTYPEVFDKICFNLPIGDISQIVKSDYGYHIFKVIDKRGPVKESLADSTDYITKLIKQQRSNEAIETWYKALYESSAVKKNKELLKQIEVTIDEKENSEV